jgi:CRP-like cAMP-binding protein
MSSMNSLLNSLASDDFALLSGHLRPVDLTYRQMLVRYRCRPEHIYFPEDGLVTIFALSKHRDQADVGTIGAEGCTGIEVILGCERANYNAVVQIAGRAQRLETSALIELSKQSGSLQSALLRYAYVALTQARETALANARATIYQRAARWILMAGRGTRQHHLQITHEDLSTALGVRRAGVTIALRRLAETGVIELTRGHIFILDAEGLLAAARGYYAALEGGSHFGASRTLSDRPARALAGIGS